MKTKTYMAFFLPIVLAGLNGCASPGLSSGYNVQISDEFTADEISGIETGMQSWAQFKDGPVFSFEVVPAFSLPQEKKVPWTSIVVKKTTLENVKALCQDSDVIACTVSHGELAEIETGEYDLEKHPIGPTVYLPNQSDIKFGEITSYWQAVAHETGHAMGLRHTGEHTIMCKDLGCAAKEPTCQDLQYYCNLRNQTCVCDEKNQ